MLTVPLAESAAASVAPPGQITAELLENVAMAVAAAIVIVVSGYGKNRARGGESFNPYQALATLIVAIAIAAAAGLAGIPVTAEYLEIQLSAYAGIIYVVQNLLRALVANTNLSWPGDPADTGRGRR